MIMLLSIWLSLLAVLNAQDAGDLSSRILFGTKADIKEYPYFAHLSNCGAAIISDRWLATAAHCVFNETLDGGVWVGGEKISNSKEYEYDIVVYHPEYYVGTEFELPVHDIALVRLTQPLTFSETVQPLQLPQEWYEYDAPHAFAGKGRDETGRGSKELMKVDLLTLYLGECLDKVNNDSILNELLVDPNYSEMMMSTICTTRVEDKPGLCYGDSGSPLVRDNVLVGLASYLFNPNCMDARVTMFTNVVEYVEFIKAITGIP